jgi:hypothetical protein
MNPSTTVILLVVFAGLSFLTYLVLLYVYFALSLSTIGEKLGKDNRILAWIPIANVIFTLELAGRPWWWIFFLLIPFVNIILMVIIWMDIARNNNQPPWIGLLTLIPIAQFILPGYLAYVAKDGKDHTHAAPFKVLIAGIVFLLLAIGMTIGVIVAGAQSQPQVEETFSVFKESSPAGQLEFLETTSVEY